MLCEPVTPPKENTMANTAPLYTGTFTELTRSLGGAESGLAQLGREIDQLCTALEANPPYLVRRVLNAELDRLKQQSILVASAVQQLRAAVDQLPYAESN
jgi:hypothetical protein